jgi:wyosine [tRNA(Phe)-imidazoG37] synthetase (radical SAM superfamily)
VTALCFGPVPSRRLGRSLGINNIPPKFCSYACVYCQVGRTAELVAERRAFFPPEEVVGEVEKRVRELRERGEPIDYLAFVPDGEPTRTCTSGRRSRPCEASAFPSR